MTNQIKDIGEQIGKKYAQLKALDAKFEILSDKIAEKYSKKRKEEIKYYQDLFKKNNSPEFVKEKNIEMRWRITELHKKEERYINKTEDVFESMKVDLSRAIDRLKKKLKDVADGHNDKIHIKIKSSNLPMVIKQPVNKVKKFGKTKVVVITAAILSGIIYAAYVKYKKIEDEKIQKLKSKDLS